MSAQSLIFQILVLQHFITQSKQIAVRTQFYSKTKEIKCKVMREEEREGGRFHEGERKSYSILLKKFSAILHFIEFVVLLVELHYFYINFFSFGGVSK